MEKERSEKEERKTKAKEKDKKKKAQEKKEEAAALTRTSSEGQQQESKSEDGIKGRGPKKQRRKVAKTQRSKGGAKERCEASGPRTCESAALFQSNRTGWRIRIRPYLLGTVCFAWQGRRSKRPHNLFLQRNFSVQEVATLERIASGRSTSAH